MSVRSLGGGPLVRASAFDLPRPARWGTCLLYHVTPPPPPPNRVDVIRPAPESVEIPLFTPSNGGLSTSVGASAAAAGATILRQPPAGEYTSSPSAGLPARLSRRIVELEFVEISELLPDSWQEETQPLVVFDAQLNPRRLSRKAPVQDISLWIECFSRMAAVLVTRYPDKGPELWAYQASIVRAARNYEGLAWVAYDRQYRREALARKDLNWSATNSRLYNEAFTGRAKAIPRCCHCLSDSHTTAHCTLDATLGTPTQVHPNAGSSSGEICRSYNAGRCQHVRCRYTAMSARSVLTRTRGFSARRTVPGGDPISRECVHRRGRERVASSLASVSCIHVYMLSSQCINRYMLNSRCVSHAGYKVMHTCVHTCMESRVSTQ